MIQRIQSIYLLFTMISMYLIAFKVPVYSSNEELFMAIDDTKIFVLTIIVMLFSLIGFFLFKKLKLQMKLIRLAVLVKMVIVVRLFMVYYEFGVSLNSNCIFLILFALISLIMAYIRVKKDYDLIRSVDRIR